jgi:hypothetical protein
MMTDFLQAWAGIFLANLTWEMSGNILIFFVVMLLVGWLIRQSFNRASDVRLEDLFLDPVTRKIGTSTMRLNVAYVATTFLYILVVIKDSAQFVAATTVYAGLWVLDKARSAYFDKKQENPNAVDDK